MDDLASVFLGYAYLPMVAGTQPSGICIGLFNI